MLKRLGLSETPYASRSERDRRERSWCFCCCLYCLLAMLMKTVWGQDIAHQKTFGEFRSYIPDLTRYGVEHKNGGRKNCDDQNPAGVCCTRNRRRKFRVGSYLIHDIELNQNECKFWKIRFTMFFEVCTSLLTVTVKYSLIPTTMRRLCVVGVAP